MRKLKAKPMGIETLLLQYKLNTEQGIALMCLAEAMLRVPDRGTINELIQDKLGDGDWANTPMMQSLVNRSMYWGLVISGKVLSENQSIYIPLGSKHRLSNPGKIPLVLIEVQSGAYVGEDDIVRFQDVYGRSH